MSYSDRKAVAAALRPIYQAPSEEAAWEALETFEASELGQRYPAAVRTFTDSWERFTPFLAFPPMVRRVISPPLRGRYPLHQRIEAASYQLRKVTRNRGHFPSDEAAVKLLWLAICNIEDKRARQRQKEQQKGRAGKSATTGRLIEGAITTNWKQALQQLSLAYPDRINPHL